MSGQSFIHATRRSMTPLRALRIFQASGSKCSCCGRKLTSGDDWDIDHRIALENGGSDDDDDNLQVLCPWCHKPKTADDHGYAAKGKRMAVRSFVPKRFQQRRGWLR